MSSISNHSSPERLNSVSIEYSLKEILYEKNNAFADVFSKCQRRKYKLNEELFTPFDKNRAVYLIISGKVKITTISDKGRIVSAGYFKKDDFINLEATIGAAENRITAISKSKNTVAIQIEKRTFLRKLNRRPDLQRHIFSQILLNKAEAEQRIHRILDIRSNERVFDFFYHHTLKFGQRVGYEYVIREPLTHREVSEYIGSSRQTVTTAMNILRRKGILHFNRKYWLIRDIKALKKLVDNF